LVRDYKGVVKTRKSVKLNEKDVENAITEAQIELENAERGLRISKRLQNTEKYEMIFFVTLVVVLMHLSYFLYLQNKIKKE
jgi:hypothetical protein